MNRTSPGLERQVSGAWNRTTSPRRGASWVYASVLTSTVSPTSIVCSIATDGTSSATCAAK
jgi:hypothetical protein